MSIHKLRNGLIRHARDGVYGDLKVSDEGVVSAFDPVTQSAKVTLQPSGVETGWIQCKTPWAGAGWGLFSPPIIGSVVTVHYENGDINTASIGLRAHNDVDNPLPVPSGEFWLVHKSGMCLKLPNDGTVILGGIASPVGSIMIGDPAALHQMMTDVAMATYNEHKHISSAPGTPTTVPMPDFQMTNAVHLTQQTKAS